MRIGIIGPIATADIRHLLHHAEAGETASQGYPGAPFMATLISTYLQMGHEVVGFTSDRTLDPSSEPLCLEGPGFRLWLCPARPTGMLLRHGHLGRIWDFFRLERKKLAQAVQRERMDVLHAHWIYEFAMVAKASGIPAIATAHDAPDDIVKLTTTPYTIGRYLMARKVLSSDIPLTAVSGYVAERLERKRFKPIPVIVNPLPSWLREVPIARAKSERNDEPLIVAMVPGHWTSFKNPLPGILAFVEERKSRGRKIVLRIYGPDFAPGGKAEKLIRRAGIPLQDIELCGRVAHRDLLAELSEADVLVHPSLTEAFCMAVAEAMALNVPVIAGAKVGGIPWMLAEGAAGQLVDVTDPLSIAKAIRQVIERPEEIHAMADRASERIWHLADPSTIAERYLALYEEVIG